MGHDFDIVDFLAFDDHWKVLEDHSSPRGREVFAKVDTHMAETATAILSSADLEPHLATFDAYTSTNRISSGEDP